MQLKAEDAGAAPASTTDDNAEMRPLVGTQQIET
jgi:hypothetical protein